jgi:hypothetical protein
LSKRLVLLERNEPVDTRIKEMQGRIKVLKDQLSLAREAAVEFTEVALKAVAERGVSP